MKQAVLWLIPAVALASVGSLTYATSRPLDDGIKKHDSKVVTKTVPFAHDSKIDAYLTSIRSYMLVPPRDGQFGASRVPTFHGTNIGAVPSFQDIASLRSELSVMSYVVGVMPEGQKQSYKEYKMNHPEATFTIPEYRVTRVNAIAQEGEVRLNGKRSKLDKQDGYQKLNSDILSVVSKAKGVVDKERYDIYSTSVNIAGSHGFIMAKAVRAVDNSCYTCHSTIKPGEPIGHVVAVIWNKDHK